MAKLHEILQLASGQHGLLTHQDLRTSGCSRGQVMRLVRTGVLLPLGRRTFGVAGLPSSPDRAVMLACLESGGVATRGTAAWLHGLGAFGPGNPPAVVVPKVAHDYRSELAEVHTSTWLPSDDVLPVRGVPCLSVARTIFSLAAAVPEIDLEVVADVVDLAIRDGKASDAWLWWLLERIRCRGRNGVTTMEGLLTARAGGAVTESWLEREFRQVLSVAGVPLPRCQRRIERRGSFVARVDFAYVDRRIAIEVTGHTHHSSRRQRDADARRRNELALAGWTVIEFTYDDLVSDPAYVVAKVRELLAGQRRSAA